MCTVLHFVFTKMYLDILSLTIETLFLFYSCIVFHCVAAHSLFNSRPFLDESLDCCHFFFCYR